MSILRRLFRRPEPVPPPVLTKDDARSWLRAGRPCTLREWSALDAETRDALEAAGIEHVAEVALIFGAAVAGPEGAALVTRMVDGGEAGEVVGIESALEHALGRRGGRP